MSYLSRIALPLLALAVTGLSANLSFAAPPTGLGVAGVGTPQGVSLNKTRLTDNGNGTVTDNISGLVWLKNANCFNRQNWSKALASAKTLANGACGLSDGSTAGRWRLPDRSELQIMATFLKSSQASSASQPFTGMQNSYYWTSSSNASFADYASSIYMGNAYEFSNGKSSENYLWPVRSK